MTILTKRRMTLVAIAAAASMGGNTASAGCSSTTTSSRKLRGAQESSAIGAEHDETSNNSNSHRQLAPLEDGNCKHAWARLSLDVDQNRESPVCFAGLDFRCGPLGDTWGLSSVVDVVDNDLVLGTAYMVTADTCHYSRTPQDLVGGDLTLVNEELVGSFTYTLNVPVGEITLNWDSTTALLPGNNDQYYYKELHWYAGPDALYKITPGAFTIDPEEYPYQQTELTSIPQSETRSIEIDDTVSPFKFYLSIHALVCEVPRTLASS